MKLANKKFLGIIPARANSKGIKNKNIIRIKNKPLIYYTINEAKKSKLLNELIVSTDSKRIAKISMSYNIKVPFLRPFKYATDYSNIIHTLKDSLIKMQKLNNTQYDYIVLLQPTSPNRKKNEIDNAIKKILREKKDSFISLCKVDEPHPFKLKEIKNKRVIPFVKFKDNAPRQKLKKLYMPSGNLYITSKQLLLKNKITGNNPAYDIIDNKNYLNINNIDDIILAKAKL